MDNNFNGNNNSDNNNNSDSLYSYSYLNQENQERNPNYYERQEANQPFTGNERDRKSVV